MLSVVSGGGWVDGEVGMVKMRMRRAREQNQKWAKENVSYDYKEPVRTLGIITNDEVSIKVGKDLIHRAYLAEWLPITLQDTKLDIIFSTNEHGKTLDALYRHCAKVKHTIMLIEVQLITFVREPE